ncbi:alpha/beta hydrolase [Variovorax sp. KK3]|uniref:alpha/beta hydrolase n=1 Tax=Variovorax sp. KK3 TaxID=1855728 RepID=UPI0015C3B7DB|nr:alpha/beta fold hydrolase [Variovorax sp. KK3]
MPQFPNSANSPPPEPKGPILGYSLVKVFYGTDRRPDTNPSTQPFTGARGPLTLGAVTVSIPLGHKMGTVERPGWFLGQFTDGNPDKHFMLRKQDSLSPEEFFTQVNATLVKTRRRTAFVFVHGFNVGFNDAAYRTAQIAVDLGIGALPTFFSWPSQNEIEKYTVDEANAEWAEPHLKDFLEKFADNSRASEIFVVAHSMGARPATRALSALLSSRLDLRPRFREIVLAAPDIDAEVFLRDIAPRITANDEERKRGKREGPQLTLYVSARDEALAASHKVHGSPRAGDAGPTLVVMAGIDTVDASRIDTDFLAHSYYGDARALLTDISLVFGRHMGASERPGLDPATSLGGNDYWAFRR